jgi:GntR family transcriptional regulator
MLSDKNITSNKIVFDARPLHLRLEEAIELLLKEYGPGDRLPSEEKLSELMGVSRATIREYLGILEERGRIVRRHGVGTFIASAKPLFESGLEILESMDAFASRMGFVCEVKDLNIREEPADADMAAKLKLKEGAALTVVTRTSVIQNTPVAYIYDAMPASIITADDLKPHFTGSVLDYLKDKMKPVPWSAVTNLLSIEASKDISQRMQIPLGAALLLLEEYLYRADTQLINYSRRYYNTKYFQYHIIRRCPA